MKISKNILLMLVFALFVVLGSGCRVHRHGPQYHKRGMIISTHPSGKIPPGQMKKMMGDKSAKAYTPGHNKSPKGYASGHNKGPKVQGGGYGKSGSQGKNKPHKYNKGKKGR